MWSVRYKLSYTTLNMWNNILYYLIYLIAVISQVGTMEMKDLIIPSNFTAVTSALVHILKFCEKQYDTVIVQDDENGNIVNLLSISQPLASIILYKDLKITQKSIEYMKKVDAVIICKESPEKLETILDNFSQASWWNEMIPHFVLEKTNSFPSDASTLNLLLAKDIVIAHTMGLDKFGFVTIVTINPFANYAPSPWNFLASVNNRSALYIRHYDKRNVCQGFYFDRTRYLNGHEINIVLSAMHAGNPKDSNILKNKTYDEKSIQYVLLGPLLFHLNILISTLNITIKLRFLPQNKIYEQNKIDLSFESIAQDADNNELMGDTFPTHFFQISFLVQNRGYKTPSEKVWDYYGPCTLISMILILSITFIVLKLHNKNKGLAFSTFEILRLLINTGIYTRINSRPLKIFFSVVFLYFFIIHATFSGHIVNFLTKPELRPNPNTFEDLKDPQYKKIYIPVDQIEWITEPEFMNKKSIVVTHFRNVFKCFEAVELAESNVCIHHHEMLSVYYLYRQMLQKVKKVHQPLKGFGFYYSLYKTRQQWSLKSRIDKIFMWLFETGNSDVLSSAKKWITAKLKNRKREFIQEELDDIPLSLEMLIFSFIILGVGLTCATISFIIEVCNPKFNFTII